MKANRKPSAIYLDEDGPQHVAPNVRVLRRRGSKLIAFGWYGGKFSHLDWLLTA
jgi:DNA adenine methylase